MSKPCADSLTWSSLFSFPAMSLSFVMSNFLLVGSPLPCPRQSCNSPLSLIFLSFSPPITSNQSEGALPLLTYTHLDFYLASFPTYEESIRPSFFLECCEPFRRCSGISIASFPLVFSHGCPLFKGFLFRPQPPDTFLPKGVLGPFSPASALGSHISPPFSPLFVVNHDSFP